jgi:DNA-binding CsgD family transcriptional regulator
MRRGRPPHPDVLTPRQWQVVALLHEGLTNERIAARLGITADGAKYHVAEIISKLGVSTREEAAQAAERRRRQPVALPWFALLRRPWLAFAGIGAAILATVAILAFALPGHSSMSRATDHEQAQADIAAESPQPSVGATSLQLNNSLLWSKGEPANIAGADLRGVRRVATVEELRAALTPTTKLIVVDRSVLDEARTSGVLHPELAAGRYVVGLNVSNNALREAVNFAALIPGLQPTMIREPTDRTTPHYSLVNYGQQWAGTPVIVGGYQKYFSEGTFEADLAELDAGRLPNGEGPPVAIALLPPERIAVNRGMGCVFDDTKTALATRREVAGRHPSLKVPSLMIVYCNPAEDSNVIIGVLVPPQPGTMTPELVRFTVPRSQLLP